ncbi:MAG: hypothetical protein OXH00_11945 [Candidatus Poribacteria bacterium]|nr:hypothetical protein [Candidatus Poribacteria bacterium]
MTETTTAIKDGHYTLGRAYGRMNTTQLILISLLLLSGCSTHEMYSPIDRKPSIIGKNYAQIRKHFGAPHIIEGTDWYYFDSTEGVVCRLHFKSLYPEYFPPDVATYSEQRFDETTYYLWIPKLIEQLAQPDPEVAARAYRFLEFIIHQDVYGTETPQPEVWDKIPFESRNYGKWKIWWRNHGTDIYRPPVDE